MERQRWWSIEKWLRRLGPDALAQGIKNALSAEPRNSAPGYYVVVREPTKPTKLNCHELETFRKESHPSQLRVVAKVDTRAGGNDLEACAREPGKRVLHEDRPLVGVYEQIPDPRRLIGVFLPDASHAQGPQEARGCQAKFRALVASAQQLDYAASDPNVGSADGAVQTNDQQSA